MAEEKIVPKAAIGSSAENAYKGPETDRRGFISWLSFGWLAYLGVTGGFFTMIVRFLFPNVLFEPPQTFKIGYPDDFSKNSVDIKYKKQFNAWIVRDEESIFALSTVCTHLGCTPNWLPVESKFKCPCHGSGFRMTGIHFEGPAPRPLEIPVPRVIFNSAKLVSSACSSVLAQIICTPSIPLSTIWLTAFPPAPPTPKTKSRG